MRGFVSFVLALSAILAAAFLANLYVQSGDLSHHKAVEVQRLYSINMNAKEVILESALHGARQGFLVYDSSHDVKLCRHCPDHHCSVSSPHNYCDSDLCLRCFREKDARAVAEAGAYSVLHLLEMHNFDPDFNVSIGAAAIHVFLEADSSRENGFFLSHIIFTEDLAVFTESKKLGICGESPVPRGCVIYEKGPSHC
ncbi:hypothetical protein GF318_01445 [Candidatus Micrarchaeota archaeon]|nr:hypothetical protein [Candidatus Micrarchaeota archaeon]